MTQDNLIALKPCPFCGGEAALSEGGGKHVTYVFCSRVGCSAEMSASLDPALAKAKWNTRTIERLSPPPKAKPRRKKEGPCGCDVDPFGCERHPS